jgi:hypothetical protein
MHSGDTGIEQHNLRYLISTHRRYEDATLPRIIKSMTEISGIPPEQILIVSGGCEELYDTTFHGIEYHGVTHNSFDHNGLIDVIDRRLKADYWFALHDTCEVGPRFYELSQAIDPSLEHISVSRVGWLNMGAFSQKFLEREADYVLSLRNCDKVRAIYTERGYLRLACSGHYGTGEIQGRGFSDTYGKGTQRLHLYMPGLDLHKYQANWKALEIPLVHDP